MGGLEILLEAYFAKNPDLISNLNCIIFLADDTNSATVIVFRFYKSCLTTRSSMAVEVIAFDDLLNAAVPMRKNLSIVSKNHVSVQLVTDCTSLFEVNTSNGINTNDFQRFKEEHNS